MTSRKDYERAASIVRELIGEVFRGEHENKHFGVTRSLIEHLSDWFSEDNPNFNRARFNNACIVSQAEAWEGHEQEADKDPKTGDTYGDLPL